MTHSASPISGQISGSSLATQRISALAVVAFGILLVAGTGFVQPHAIHEGTHDTRHAFALPCH
jgi:cobalt transporter subunit CbtB